MFENIVRLIIFFHNSFERTINIQNSNISFFYNRFLTGISKSLGKFRIQLLIYDINWSTRYNLPENDRYSTSTTDWHLLVNFDLTVEKFGMKLNYHPIDTALADIHLSSTTLTHCVY